MSKVLIVGILVTALLVPPGATASSDPAVQAGKIAFLRERPGSWPAIALVDLDRANTRLLTRPIQGVSPPAWSPDGNQLAFTGRGALWVMNADGSNRRRLATAIDDAALGPELAPSWSADGSRIAFERNPSTLVNASAVYTIRASGGGLRRLTSERFAYDPLWSPRGDLIAFRSDRDDDEGDIYLMRADGSGQRRLTNERKDIESFTWSPDGRSLTHASYDGPVYRVDVSGGPRRLLARMSAAEPDLTWSPDGRRIAYCDESVREGGDISVMTAGGLNERRLTNRYFNLTPTWSPDSRRIVYAFFTRLEGPSRHGLVMIDADGKNRRELTSWAGSFPVWQPVP